jgi:hypothetical protein
MRKATRIKHPAMTARIESVVITWCSRTGKRKQMEVDLNKACGFLWNYDPDHPIRDLGNPGSVRIPRRKLAVIGSCTPPKPIKANSPAACCCWWDGTQWVCPDEPAEVSLR